MTAYADILRQVEVWPPSPDSDELGRLGPSDYGTAAAGEIAFRMLESGARLLLPSDISFDRDGAVRIVWEQGDKTLELVCPYEQSQRPYLFYSNDDQHGIAHDLSKTRLNRLLSWLNGKLTEFPR